MFIICFIQRFHAAARTSLLVKRHPVLAAARTPGLHAMRPNCAPPFCEKPYAPTYARLAGVLQMNILLNIKKIKYAEFP